MRPLSFHLPSALLGAVVVGLGVSGAVFAGPQKAKAKAAWEYKIVTDVSEKNTREFAEQGWEYVGYLGQSPLGTSVDETLWRRPGG